MSTPNATMSEGTRTRCAVMFTDVCGSTSLYEERGDEYALGLVARHDRLLMPVVTRHGGVVVKTIGDSIMARFADAGAAVDAAIAMQRALDDERRTTAFPLAIRIGIHVDDVLERAGDLYGDGVNTAARVEGLCGPHGILVSRPVRDAIAGLDRPARSIGAVTLKGKRQPVEVFQVSWSGTFAEYADTVPREAWVFVARGEPADATADVVALSPGRLDYLRRSAAVDVEPASEERLDFLPRERVWRRKERPAQHYLVYAQDVAERPTTENLRTDVEAMLETAELLAADSVVFLPTGRTRGLNRRDVSRVILSQYGHHVVRLAGYGRTSISTVGLLVHGPDAASAYELAQYRAPFDDPGTLASVAARMDVRSMDQGHKLRLARATGCAEILSGRYLTSRSTGADVVQP